MYFVVENCLQETQLSNCQKSQGTLVYICNIMVENCFDVCLFDICLFVLIKEILSIFLYTSHILNRYLSNI